MNFYSAIVLQLILFEYLSSLLLNTLVEGTSTTLECKLFQWLVTHKVKIFCCRVFSSVCHTLGFVF